MAVTRVCYASRDDVKRAPDFKPTAEGNARIDRALVSSSDLIDGELKRVFYPLDATYLWDWPNWQYAAPWRLWFDQWDLISLTSITTAGVAIPNASIKLYPPNRKPGWPYTRLEIDRSTTAAFGTGSTPQQSISVAGTWGFTNLTDSAGTLAAAMSDTTGTSATVSDGSQFSAGNLLVVDSERMLVTESAAVTTGQTNVSGITTASAADVALGVTSGAALNLGEVLLIDAERLLVTDITGNTATVKRGFDGTVLATHGAATTIYAYRLLTVQRGALGSTAATHLISAPALRWRCPALIRDLCLAESVNRVLQETAGYSRTVGEGDSLRPAPGFALADMWDEAAEAYGRRGKARTRAV